MKTSIGNSHPALLLKADNGGNIAIILLETGEIDITEKVEQAVADHYCYEQAKISEPPTKVEQGLIAITKDYTITSEDSRTMLFSIDLFEEGEKEPAEIYDITAELITVY